mgnify:CR=1 FL=1
MDLFLIPIPLIAVYAMSWVAPVEDQTGAEVPLRPPPYVFAIVWPILLLLLGLAWYSARQDLGYIILTVLLSLWSLSYSIQEILGLINIVLSEVVLVYLLCIQGPKVTATWLLMPLVLWLVFAAYLNLYTVMLI